MSKPNGRSIWAYLKEAASTATLIVAAKASDIMVISRMPRLAIFLSGPVGVGKSTLGLGLAARLNGVFLDGDDFSDPSRPWYASILQTSREIVRCGLAAVEQTGIVVIAYPLSCTNWIYFRRRFRDSCVASIFVSLRASYASIVAEERCRQFSDEEHERIQIMIAEGYGARPFSDTVVDTDQADFVGTLNQLERTIRLLAEL